MTEVRTVPNKEQVAEKIGANGSSGARLVRKWGCGVLLLALVGAGGYWQFGQPKPLTQYETYEVKKGNLQVTVRATGKLEAVTTVEIGAEVTGRVLDVKVDTNDLVTSGQLLAEIDKTELLATVEQTSAQVVAADANIAQCNATLVEANLAYARCVTLREKNVLSQEQLDTANAVKLRAEAALASAKANSVVARANLKSAQTRLNKATILSSVNGIVMSRLVEPGQTVTAGFQTPVMFKLAQDLTKLRLKVDVDEADVGRVKDGMEATFSVEAYQNRKFPSRVKTLYYEPTKENNVVTYKCVLDVDNADGALRPGMTATAIITSQKLNDVFLVPNAAFRFVPPDKKSGGFGGEPRVSTTLETGMQRIWIQDASHAEPLQKEVKVGASDGTLTEVLSDNLPVGTKVLVDVKEPVTT